MNWGDRLKRKSDSGSSVKEGRGFGVGSEGEENMSKPDDDYVKYVSDVREDLTEIVPESPKVGVVQKNGDSGVDGDLSVVAGKLQLDFDKVLSGLGEGDSATAGIRELGRKGENLAMISNLTRPERVTAVQVHKAFQESIGFKKRAAVRGWLLDYLYMHGCAKVGKDNRAKMLLESYKVEVEKKFEIDKKSGAQRLMT